MSKTSKTSPWEIPPTQLPNPYHHQDEFTTELWSKEVTENFFKNVIKAQGILNRQPVPTPTAILIPSTD